ncbi:MAG: tryptophan synthase subunit alpha [Rikenellaceae bacterium]
MNRIDKLFQDRASNLLSVYYPAGFPNFGDTLNIALELERNGVELIEVGIPFSDPMADGVVIQEAATEALKGGITLRKIFEQLKPMRDELTIPVILMGYLNPIMRYGFEEFCRSCSEVGVDGVIIPDLPYKDYMANYKDIADKYGVNVIMLITPETSLERVKMIDDNTSGFIYMVSTAATTGAQESFSPKTVEYFERIAAMELKNPRLIGFGISNAPTYNDACNHASGAIVGSFFVKLLSSEPNVQSAVRKLLETLER